MPRYFFHCADGVRIRDTEGTDLPDDASAHQAGIRFAGEVLQEAPEALWKKGQWRVEVTDADDDLLFTIITLTVDAPRAHARPSIIPAND